MERQVRELALFNLAIDSKLRVATSSPSGSMTLPPRLCNRAGVRAPEKDRPAGTIRANRADPAGD
jgi:hypothetical protein